MRFPYVSARAVVPEGCRVAVLPASGASRVGLLLGFPRAACPVSGNPILGVVRIAYQPGAVVAEVVSVHELVRDAAGQTSIEGAAAWLHDEMARALGVPVVVELWLLVRPGPQVYRVRCG